MLNNTRHASAGLGLHAHPGGLLFPHQMNNGFQPDRNFVEG